MAKKERRAILPGCLHCGAAMPRRKKPVLTLEELRAKQRAEDEQEHRASLLRAAGFARQGEHRRERQERAGMALVYLLLLIGAGLVLYLLLAHGVI